MSCLYCKNKVKNAYIVQSHEEDSGVEAKVIRNDGIALLAVDGWFDHIVVIEPQFMPIRFCPMCGDAL